MIMLPSRLVITIKLHGDAGNNQILEKIRDTSIIGNTLHKILNKLINI